MPGSASSALAGHHKVAGATTSVHSDSWVPRDAWSELFPSPSLPPSLLLSLTLSRCCCSSRVANTTRLEREADACTVAKSAAVSCVARALSTADPSLCTLTLTDPSDRCVCCSDPAIYALVTQRFFRSTTAVGYKYTYTCIRVHVPRYRIYTYICTVESLNHLIAR